MSVAYPGLWVRPDVYATHGHYLDCHLTVPTIERLSVAAMGRVLGRPAASFSRVEDYEAVGAPVFAWRDTVAREARMGNALNRVDTIRAWRALAGNGGGSSRVRKLRGLALAGAFPLAVAALNRAGLGPLRTDISTEELRRAGLRAMGEVAERLGLGERVCDLRPHASRRAAPGRQRVRVARARRRAADELRLLDVRPRVSRPRRR